MMVSAKEKYKEEQRKQRANGTTRPYDDSDVSLYAPTYRDDYRNYPPAANTTIYNRSTLPSAAIELVQIVIDVIFGTDENGNELFFPYYTDYYIRYRPTGEDAFDVRTGEEWQSLRREIRVVGISYRNRIHRSGQRAALELMENATSAYQIIFDAVNLYYSPPKIIKQKPSWTYYLFTALLALITIYLLYNYMTFT